MSDKQKGTTRVQDHAGTVKKGLTHDVLLPIAQEAKPIAEATAAALLAQKLGGGKNPPSPSGDEKG